MNDSILFLALATIFGVAMLIVGWAGRGYYQDRVMDGILRDWQTHQRERRAIDRRAAIFGRRDQMDRPFLDG